jgi:hypothetical protein
MTELNNQSEERLSRNIALLEQGLLSAREVAEDFICDAIASQRIPGAVALLSRLPESARVEVAAVFHTLRNEDYAWQPLWIGPTPRAASSDFSQQLRQLDMTLTDSLADIPVETASSAGNSEGHA